jgi:hypothetical protein
MLLLVLIFNILLLLSLAQRNLHYTLWIVRWKAPQVIQDNAAL